MKIYNPSNKKFWFLMLTSIGMYGFYYLYILFRDFNRHDKHKGWPIFSVIFSIFTIAYLTRRIRSLKTDITKKDLNSTTSIASIYIFFIILTNILSKNEEINFWLIFLASFPIYWSLYMIKENISSLKDENISYYGKEINSTNIFWLFVFIILDVLLIIGSFV